MSKSAEEKLHSYGVRNPDRMQRLFLRGARVLE